MTSLLPALIAIHVVLAIALVLPSIVLPFALRGADAAGATQGHGPGRLVRGLVWLQAHGTLVIGMGLAATGVGLLLVLGTDLLTKPWLLIALVIYAGNLLLAFFVQRPNLRRLLGAERNESAWRVIARRQRYVSYVMAGLVGSVGYLMSTKPVLW